MTADLRTYWQRVHHYCSRDFGSRWESGSFLAAMTALAFLFPFSLLFVVGGLLPPSFSWASSVIILIGGAATLLADMRHAGRVTAIFRFAVIAVVLFAVELLGVRTGFPFGGYSYTARLGPAVAGVPVAIAIAWYCTVMNTWRIAERLTGHAHPGRPLLTALAAGIMTLGLDCALEPMAGFVERYWVWDGQTIPLQNYLSWFVLSCAAVFVLARAGAKPRPKNAVDPFPAALFLFGTHVVLFLLTSAVHGYVLQAALALCLTLLPAMLLGPSRLFLHPVRTEGR
jgi:uncharacterized membrane protein